MTKFLVGLEKFLHSLTHSFCRYIVKALTFPYLFLKQQKVLHLFCQHMTKRNTTHSGGVSFWSTFDLRCKSPACGDFYRKAEGNPQRFPSQTPPSSRRTKDSAFVRRKELAADTHARSAFQSEVRQGLCVEPISSMPRAWI